MVLKIGDSAPHFNLPADSGEEINLSQLQGKKVVLYFYPKDDTPGCTLEAQDFSKHNEDFKRKNATVIGISKDSVDSHCTFKSKYALNVILVSDEDTAACTAYGVWKEKSMYGKKYMGIERTTFLIDEKGKVGKIWPNVKVENHVQEVLNSL